MKTTQREMTPVGKNDSPFRLKKRVLGRYGQSLVICFLAFCLSTFMVGKLSGRSPAVQPYMPLVSEKLAAFERNKDTYDAIFIGSSRTYRQIDPDRFDTLMGEQGYDTNSFNFGLVGMKLPETHFWLNHILEMKPKKLKWVFVETTLNNIYEPLSNARTNRVMYWHTSSYTWLSLDYILKSKDTFPRKVATAYSHLIPFIYNVLNVGDFSNTLSASLTGDRAEAASPATVSSQPAPNQNVLGAALNGYKSLDEEPGKGYQRTHRAFLDNVDSYEKKVTALKNRPLNQAAADDGGKALLTQFSQLTTQASVMPIFVLPPRIKPEDALIKLESEGYLDAFLRFNDPQKYSELYSSDSRFDEVHLNAKGAQIFTQLVAEGFIDYLNGGGITP